MTTQQHETKAENCVQSTEEHVLPNLDLPGYAAMQYPEIHGFGRDDLSQEGVIGLMDADKRYDPGRGATYRTFARHRVNGAVLDAYLKYAGLIYRPHDVLKQEYKMHKVESDLRGRLGRNATTIEVAKEMDVKPKRVEFLRRHSCKVVSIEGEVGGKDSDLEPHDVLPDRNVIDPFEAAAKSELPRKLAELIAASGITDKEKDALEARFGLGDNEAATLREIGKERGYTESGACDAVKRALRKLRVTPGIEEFRYYLAED